MDTEQLYKDIKARTNGEIYIGVVGPVRTGKSTFIKNFMDLLVIPNIDNEYKKERAKAVKVAQEKFKELGEKTYERSQ